MKTIEDIVKFCREHPESNVCIFPYQDSITAAGDIFAKREYIRIKVENPFFDEEIAIKHVKGLEPGLREAPKRLKEMSYKILGRVTEHWDL